MWRVRSDKKQHTPLVFPIMGRDIETISGNNSVVLLFRTRRKKTSKPNHTTQQAGLFDGRTEATGPHVALGKHNFREDRRLSASPGR